VYKNGVAIPGLLRGTYLLLVTTMPRFILKTSIFAVFHF